MYDDLKGSGASTSKVMTRSAKTVAVVVPQPLPPAEYTETATAAVPSVSSPLAEELEEQLEETTAQLAEARTVSKALRDKLRECSRQLQEYENERSAVVEILARHGVEVVLRPLFKAFNNLFC